MDFKASVTVSGVNCMTSSKYLSLWMCLMVLLYDLLCVGGCGLNCMLNSVAHLPLSGTGFPSKEMTMLPPLSCGVERRLLW